MSDSTNSVLERARQAALSASGEAEAVADMVDDYAPEDATYAAADAAMRVLLTELIARGGATPEELTVLLKEIGDA